MTRFPSLLSFILLVLCILSCPHLPTNQATSIASTSDEWYGTDPSADPTHRAYMASADRSARKDPRLVSQPHMLEEEQQLTDQHQHSWDDESPDTILLQLSTDSSALLPISRHRPLRKNKQKDHGHKKLSFTERARRRNEANLAAARHRAGKYAKYLVQTHKSRDGSGERNGHHIDFGCAESHAGRKCHCPLPLTASFSELHVAGYDLASQQRLQESSACFEQALDLYLSRVGRYVTDGKPPSDNPAQHDASVLHQDGSVGVNLNSKPSAVSPGSSKPIPLTAGDIETAKATAQAIVDRLQAGPKEGWFVEKRHTYHPAAVERLQHLADLAKEGMAKLDGHGDGADSTAPVSASVHNKPKHHHWYQSSLFTNKTKSHEIVKIYQQQLRDQWKSWTQQQDKEQPK